MNDEAGDDAVPPPPPPMCDAWLDEPLLLKLFDDLAATRIISVSIKANARAHGESQPPSLERAITLLVSDAVRAVQIRYLFDHHEWCDTIMKVHQKYRLVRVQSG